MSFAQRSQNRRSENDRLPSSEERPRGPGRRATLLAIALALLFALPSLRTGFFLDDFHQVGLIEGWHEIDTPAFDLYDSFLDFPGIPWWYSEQASTGFWRPLSSAFLWLDHALFGRWAVGWHLHTLLWLAAFVAVTALLYGWLPRRIAILALVMVALEEAHGMTSGILCNRHTLLSSVPAFFGLWLYLRSRRDGWPPGRWASPLVFGLAFFFGETTVAVLAYALAWELAGSRDSWPVRLRSIAPLAALALTYVGLYAAFDLGPHHTTVYLNPFESPAELARGMVQRVPALLAGALTGFPASLWMTGSQAQLALVGIGCLASLALLLFLWRSWADLEEPHRRSVAFWLLGALGSLPVVGAALPSDRQLLVPAMGLAVVLATVVERLWSASTLHGKARAPGPRRLRRAVALLVLLVHVVGAGWARVQIQNGSTQLTDRLQVAVEELEEIAALHPDRSRRAAAGSGPVGLAAGQPVRFVVAHVPDFFLAIYPPVMWTYARGVDGMEWCVLSMAPQAQVLERTTASTLELRPVEGNLLATWDERIMQPDPAVEQQGARLSRPCATIEILDTSRAAEHARPRSTAGRQLDPELPRHVRFDFEADLEAEGWLLITWENGRFRAVEMPAVGGRVEIEPDPGLLATL